MRLAIVGGGAAGFFLAVNVGRMVPGLEITIYERARRVLAKVEVSGGGRCNCTNTFASITDLKQAYPRGATLLKRLFKRFGPRDAYVWFERHGVPLVVQDDECVFPEAQDSHAIIDCFLREARRLGVKMRLGCRVDEPEALLCDYDFVAVTVGGTPNKEGCVPSLFTFNIKDKALHGLMGTVVEDAVVAIPGTKMRAGGALLITHWGMSGPAILKLSSYAARYLADNGYRAPLAVNWTGESNADVVRDELLQLLSQNPNKQIDNLRPYALPSRLWQYLLAKAVAPMCKGEGRAGKVDGRAGKGGNCAGSGEERAGSGDAPAMRCADVGKKTVNRLTELLTNDAYTIDSRCHYKDEFVTCGGVPLDAVDSNTLESKSVPGLYYAGEVLDIDGITGGFNLQAAWTTAYTVAQAIAAKTSEHGQ